MNRRANIIGVWVLLGLVAVFLLLYDTRRIPAVPYSDFRILLRDRAIESIRMSGADADIKLLADWTSKVTDTTLKGSLPTGTTVVTTTLLPVDDPDLVKELVASGARIEGRASAMWLSILLSWILPLALIAGLWVVLMRRTNKSQGGVLSFGKSNVRIYKQDDVKTTFADVAGVPEAKEELQEIVEYLRTPAKFIRVGARIPKGVLLVGPPGTGKTLLARAVAGEARVAFFSISGSEFVEMFVGVGAARVRDLFETALKSAPCIIFVDELDALGKVRGVSVTGGNDEREQTLNQLLVEMDGFEPNRGVVIMAATNRPEILDPALLRPGRFDRQVLVDKPDRKGREEILRVHMKGVVIGPDVNVEQVARITPGFAGADLANVVNEAALLAARHDRDSVMQADFEEAIERVVAGLEKRGRLITEKERRIIAYHEMGHALVAESLPGQDRVQKVSIVPRGLAALGYTLQTPTEDRYLMTRSELLDRMTVLLGGQSAEELVFGEVSTGAANDLARATDVARSMVTRFGMSEGLGPVSLDGHPTAPATPWDAGTAREYGDAVANQIDAEVRVLVEDARRRASRILAKRRDDLERAAVRLLEREHLEGDELRVLIQDAPGPTADEPRTTPGA
jgi:cell division protease FtsH